MDQEQKTEQFIEKLANDIYKNLHDKGAGIGNASIIFIKQVIKESDLKSLMDKWIKCSDELPKEAKDEEKDHKLKWLICDGNSVRITAEHPSIWNYKSPIDMYSDGEIVTHWQPLLQPPKKE